jgi:CBS domain containing-hemolysin-like protein
MSSSPLFFAFAIVAALVVQGVFALCEMACLSLDKIRLHCAIARGSRRARCLAYLLAHPSRLFGTTLVGIIAALQFGSECARRFYEASGLPVDLAPLSQVLLVLVFAELVPLFAARRHPEPLALFFAFPLYLIARLLSPILYLFERLFRSKSSSLNREEVRYAFGEEESAASRAIGTLFELKRLSAYALMEPLSRFPLIPSHASVDEAIGRLAVAGADFAPVYHQSQEQIVAILTVEDLLRRQGDERVGGRSPWFVSKETAVLSIIEQFRSNKQSVAVVLDADGSAVGLLTLDQILASIFGEEGREEEAIAPLFVEKTFPGEMLVAELSALLKIPLPHHEGETLSELSARLLGHPPSRGELFNVGSLQAEVVEPSLRGAKKVRLKRGGG